MHPLKAGAMQDGVDMGLYDRFAATIFAYLYRQVASQQDAEDLLLEVFTAAFGNGLRLAATSFAGISPLPPSAMRR